MAGFDEVVLLSRKAGELFKKCHYERSVEKWRAALAAAEVLGARDCVIVARFKKELTSSMTCCEVARVKRFSQAFVLEMLDLLAASAAILRRRRDAGTLMGGKCRPTEELWYMGYYGDEWPVEGVVSISGRAALVGYEAFLAVCFTCMAFLCEVVKQCSLECGGEAERTLLSFTCDLIDDAVALMVQPRVLKQPSYEEVYLVSSWPKVLDALASPEHRVWHQRLSQADARLRQSGVLEKRGLDHDLVTQMEADRHERVKRSLRGRLEAAASSGLKSCAMAGCGAKEAHISHFGKCSACKAVVYCCRDHQQADWPSHKAACKAARKAAAKDAT